MLPRFFCSTPLAQGELQLLPAGAARHVQVLRLQPGDAIALFGGAEPGLQETSRPGGEFMATITHMGRSDVQVKIGQYQSVDLETQRAIHLAVGMPANDRMDWLVEKATELGVVSIQPLMTERSVLRLAGDRAAKKQAHWQAIVVAACEQCGRNRVPLVHGVMPLERWLAALGSNAVSQGNATAAVGLGLRRLLLSLHADALSLRDMQGDCDAAVFLSGPEGGLSAGEEAAALAAGFAPMSLGPRVLRAETAALAALTLLAS